MAKYVVVSPDKIPSPLRDGEYVINAPTFLDEIGSASLRKNSRHTLTTAPYLRSIVNMIAISYDPTLSALTQIHAHRYAGREYHNNEELSAIILEMLHSDYPQIFSKYVDKKIKDRPAGTKLIYYTGRSEDTRAFIDNGIDNMDVNDVDVYLGLKQRKVVGKPAVSNKDSNSTEE